MHNPESLEDAIALARSFERHGHVEEKAGRPNPRVPLRSHSNTGLTSPSIRTPPPASKATPSTPGAPMKPPAGSRFTRLTADEMAQRRLDGLCYNCPEKFSCDHLKHCTMKGIYLLEIAEEAAPEDEEAGSEVEISLHALVGVTTGRTLQLSTTCGATAIIALVDSGSTHSFIATATARRLGLAPSARPGLTIGVANGDRVPSTGVCRNVPIKIDPSTIASTCCRTPRLLL
ncbi:hypothetical protein BS78_01G033400 [Paspalum vaginatum]|nr:hypothetical protein BS78_01G033400 [Paspalum vaginatum]